MASIRKTKKRKKGIEKALRKYFHIVLYPASRKFAKELNNVMKSWPSISEEQQIIKFREYPIV